MKKKRILIILLLGLLSAIGPFSIDMYLPGFQAIADDLNTSVARVQLSLTTFFIGIALGQIIYGPLIDRFGRKIPLIIGLLIYIAASIGCALSQSVDNLILFRLIQALGSCAGMVASRALVRDYFLPSETAKILSLLMLVIGISPIIAPTTGGYVVLYWGWHWVFVLLAVITALILAGVVFFLKDKKGPNPEISLMPASVIRNFAEVIRLRQFIVYALSGGLAAAGLYAYISGSAFVMMGIYGVTEKQYGWIFGLLATGLIISSQLNTVLLRWFKSAKISRVAQLLQMLTGLVMLSLQLSGYLNVYSLVVLLALFLALQGFVFPNTSALALNPFSKRAGSASALMGSIQLGLGALMSFLVSLLHDETEFPMVVVMTGCSLASFMVLLCAPKRLEAGSY